MHCADQSNLEPQRLEFAHRHSHRPAPGTVTWANSRFSGSAEAFENPQITLSLEHVPMSPAAEPAAKSLQIPPAPRIPQRGRDAEAMVTDEAKDDNKLLGPRGCAVLASKSIFSEQEISRKRRLKSHPWGNGAHIAYTPTVKVSGNHALASRILGQPLLRQPVPWLHHSWGLHSGSRCKPGLGFRVFPATASEGFT